MVLEVVHILTMKVVKIGYELHYILKLHVQLTFFIYENEFSNKKNYYVKSSIEEFY